MCGDIPFRASKGGLIAVMRPLAESSSSSFSAKKNIINEFRILFNNNNSHSPHHTSARFDTSDEQTLQTLQSYPYLKLQIEKSGDLSTELPSSEPLHSFELSATQKENLEFELPSKLDLGVSNIGIVGRLVTVLSAGGKNESGHVIGRGIVGWN